MKISAKIQASLSAIILLFTAIPLFCDSGTFTAAGVQFEISPGGYTSREAFFSEVDGIVEELCASESGMDLIVFPEYIGVFYQLIEYNRIIESHESFQAALVEVLEKNPQLGSMTDVFRSGADDVESYLSGWSEIARKHGTGIIAGSCFAADDEGLLKNRSFVFDAEGTQVYSQDKVFLTDFETDIIGLEPGDINNATLFNISGKNIAMTICRDAYSREWEQRNSGAFLWVDIKANGEVFNTAQRQSFLRALPSRLFYSDVNYGLTVCAVGHYLDLFWEGESSAIRKDDGSLYLVAASGSFDRADTVFFSIPRGQ